MLAKAWPSRFLDFASLYALFSHEIKKDSCHCQAWTDLEIMGRASRCELNARSEGCK